SSTPAAAAWAGGSVARTCAPGRPTRGCPSVTPGAACGRACPGRASASCPSRPAPGPAGSGRGCAGRPTPAPRTRTPAPPESGTDDREEDLVGWAESERVPGPDRGIPVGPIPAGELGVG